MNDHFVFELVLPGYDDTAGEGKDGVLWLVLNSEESDTVQTYAEDLGNAPFVWLRRLDPATTDGIDYDSRQPGQMDALIARLTQELDQEQQP